MPDSISTKENEDVRRVTVHRESEIEPTEDVGFRDMNNGGAAPIT
jgi:hypothetical protein